MSKSATKAPIESGRARRIVDIPRFPPRPIPARGAFVADLDTTPPRVAPGAPPVPLGRPRITFRVSWRWWCGFDGSGVRRRRVTGRRRWSGGVGCGCTSSPSGRLRLQGVVAALPGAVAPERAPRLQGACPGPGRRRLRREEPTASAEATGALVDESPGVGDGQVTWIRGRCGGPGPRDHRRRGACAPRVACSRAPAAPRRPVRVLVAPADNAAVAHRPRDEGGATRNPVPGRHVGEVDHPAPVRTGRRRESRRVRAERGPGSPWRARWCAPSCPARRRSDSGARMRRTRGACGPPGGLLPGARQPPGLPGSPRRPRRSGSAPRGEDPLSTPGRRPRSTSWRAGGTGRRNRWTGRSCTPTRSGRCRSRGSAKSV